MAPRDGLLVYGATGYTARLLLPRLKQRGIEPVVAGRDAARIEALAAELGARARVFPLDDPAAVDAGLSGVGCLLNAAGPYSQTCRSLLEGCLRNQVSYLDLSGEVEPLSWAAQAGPAFAERGLMVLPAIGFDVVPSDCLAVHVARRVPDATRLTLYVSLPNLISHGSAVTLSHSRHNARRSRSDSCVNGSRCVRRSTRSK